MPRLAFLLRDLVGGGVERNTLRLARSFLARGAAVDLLLERIDGPLVDLVPNGARLVELEVGPIWRAKLLAARADPGGIGYLLPAVLLPRRPIGAYPMLPALVDYLRETRPDGLISAFPYQNLLAIAGCRAAGVDTRVVVTERSTTTALASRRWKWKRWSLPALARRSYLMADAVVAVSSGLGDLLASQLGLPRDRIATVYNPIVSEELVAAAAEPVDHPWLREGEPPVVLGCGRLTEQKDFPTLVRAFARLRATRPARLIILGTGTDPAATRKECSELRELAAALQVGRDLDLPGFVANPCAYMSKAGLFALSSRWEGFSTVLTEAIACGCPVVSTDCPSGSAEILENGRYGPLVPVGDDAALAAAMARVLDAPPDPATLRRRAQSFTVECATDAYAGLLGLRLSAGGAEHENALGVPARTC